MSQVASIRTESQLIEGFFVHDFVIGGVNFAIADNDFLPAIPPNVSIMTVLQAEGKEADP